MQHSNQLILTLDCPDKSGIVSAVTRHIAEKGASIVEANQYSDPSSHWFFMRLAIDKSTLREDASRFAQSFEPLATQFDMRWACHDVAEPKKVMILVSKLGHCLADLLYRHHAGTLPFACQGIISNHTDKAKFVEWYNIPYFHIPIDSHKKTEGMAQLEACLHTHNPDLIILARYMQVLPPALCTHFAGRIINIHHGFLPSFVGAKPYAQAHDSGVKLIGATSHFVTAELDKGPIIEQDVIRVHHGHSPDDLAHLGADIEKTVLARAVQAFLEDRILIHQNKTVVFN